MEQERRDEAGVSKRRSEGPPAAPELRWSFARAVPAITAITAGVQQ